MAAMVIAGGTRTEAPILSTLCDLHQMVGHSDGVGGANAARLFFTFNSHFAPKHGVRPLTEFHDIRQTVDCIRDFLVWMRTSSLRMRWAFRKFTDHRENLAPLLLARRATQDALISAVVSYWTTEEALARRDLRASVKKKKRAGGALDRLAELRLPDKVKRFVVNELYEREHKAFRKLDQTHKMKVQALKGRLHTLHCHVSDYANQPKCYDEFKLLEMEKADVAVKAEISRVSAMLQEELDAAPKFSFTSDSFTLSTFLTAWRELLPKIQELGLDIVPVHNKHALLDITASVSLDVSPSRILLSEHPSQVEAASLILEDSGPVPNPLDDSPFLSEFFPNTQVTRDGETSQPEDNSIGSSDNLPRMNTTPSFSRTTSESFPSVNLAHRCSFPRSGSTSYTQLGESTGRSTRRPNHLSSLRITSPELVPTIQTPPLAPVAKNESALQKLRDLVISPIHLSPPTATGSSHRLVPPSGNRYLCRSSSRVDGSSEGSTSPLPSPLASPSPTASMISMADIQQNALLRGALGLDEDSPSDNEETNSNNSHHGLPPRTTSVTFGSPSGLSPSPSRAHLKPLASRPLASSLVIQSFQVDSPGSPSSPSRGARQQLSPVRTNSLRCSAIKTAVWEEPINGAAPSFGSGLCVVGSPTNLRKLGSIAVSETQ